MVVKSMYLISVYFDEKATKTLQRYIDVIARKSGNTFMLEHQVPPHLTLSAIEARDVEVLIPAFQSLKGKVTAGEIRIVSVGELFPYVMYATPVLNTCLQELHGKVYDAVKDIDETTVSRMYRPHSWLPHITLGKTLDKEEMMLAFAAMQEQFSPLTARIERIGLAKVNPHKDVEILEL